jgi:uncharacterized Tic20 family protein
MLTALAAAEGNGGNPGVPVGIWMGVFVVFVFGLFGIYFLLPFIAAISCALGKDFCYPIMGNRLANYLEYKPAQTGDEQSWLMEDHEDRWVAAMGHFSVIIAIWGMVAPLTAWALQGKRSLFLKFQSIQTLVYQAGITILFLGTVFLCLFGILIISLIVMMGWTGNVGIDSPMGIAGIVFLGVLLLVVVIVMLFVPLLHILGQWAGYRVLNGDDYRYPLVGRLVDKWISIRPTVEEKLT